jgi:hypothetical protein
MNYFVHISNLEVEKYTNYFLNDFIPSRNFEVNPPNTSCHIQYFRKDFYQDPVILELDSVLRRKFNFPPIEYFLIFRHTGCQGIHIDGINIPRYTSLNLPLKGYEPTKMIFYKQNKGITPRITDANYYDEKVVTKVAELLGSNQWVLVDSSIPHNIIDVDCNNPRYTLCLRFFGNPTMAQLVDKLIGPA